jgi:hypothetical protein
LKGEIGGETKYRPLNKDPMARYLKHNVQNKNYFFTDPFPGPTKTLLSPSDPGPRDFFNMHLVKPNFTFFFDSGLGSVFKSRARPDSILFSDPAPLKQIISDPNPAQQHCSN